VYRADVPIDRRAKEMDDGRAAPNAFTAPTPGLFANLIRGILGGTLEWGLIVMGVMIAVALELCGVGALPVAVGMYIPLGATTPIFAGGILRFLADRIRGKPKSEADSETSPGALLASGYIAGGTLCGLIIAFFAFLPDSFNAAINLGSHLFGETEGGKTVWKPDGNTNAKIAATAMFGLLGAILLWIGSRRNGPEPANESTAEK
jgi:hypothetical protein